MQLSVLGPCHRVERYGQTNPQAALVEAADASFDGRQLGTLPVKSTGAANLATDSRRLKIGQSGVLAVSPRLHGRTTEFGHEFAVRRVTAFDISYRSGHCALRSYRDHHLAGRCYRHCRPGAGDRKQPGLRVAERASLFVRNMKLSGDRLGLEWPGRIDFSADGLRFRAFPGGDGARGGI